ncbi:toprim domain-containing protein [Asticcacaulis solisilvae]|uniref:toprim domain-containing protein n=1 Tax=Asticcacaulis solisilvae TaxID=1217274 RepID=UPI003FD8C21B
MEDAILKDVLARITSDYGLKPKGKWLQQGKCPKCGKRELYAHAEGPWVLKCGRVNNCGEEISVKGAYPEIFDTWSNRFKATEADPNAAADAYLYHNRKINLMGLRGCYSQETYHDRDRNLTSATVRFPLPGGSWWERLIDQPGRFDRKARFRPGASYGGFWWNAPDQDTPALAGADRIWIAEGIFDALALRQAGLKATSAMSVYNYPEKSLNELRRHCAEHNKPLPELVFAFDVGAAGTEYTRKFVERANKEGWRAIAAQPRAEGETDKLDWNDLLERDRLKGVDDKGRPWLETYLWYGEVLLAENATEKALLLWKRHGWSSFSFVHDNRTWWASFDEAKIAETVLKEDVKELVAARACANVSEIANCAFRILYFQEDKAIDESHYYLRVDTPTDAPPTKATFTAGTLAAAAEFKKRLLGVDPGAQWLGSTRQLDILVSQQRERGIKRVQTLDFTGYSKEHGAWVLGDLAVYRGKVLPITEEDYFDLGPVQLKLRSHDRMLSIEYDTENFDTSWLQTIWQAFGCNGIVTLTFWVMAFFAEQIRAEYKLLGFIEMSGIPGTGKSTLIEFLWKLCGRENYEGFDPSKATPAAMARNLARVANLPVVFMEGDRNEDAPHSRKFDWDEIKPLFQGRVVRSRGVKNNGNDTYEPPFRGALIIEQNYPVNASPAVMERIMHMLFTKDGWNADTKVAAELLKRWPVDSVSGTMVHIIRREDAYLAKFKAVCGTYEASFLQGGRKVRNNRIRETFAQLHAGLEALAAVMKIPADILDRTHAHIDRLAVDRDQALEADPKIVADFWDVFTYLEAQELELTNDPLNLHRKSKDLIAINLQQFEARCRKENISCPPLDELKRHLKTSKSRPFVEQATVNTVTGRHLHCWVFKTPEAAAQTKKGH